MRAAPIVLAVAVGTVSGGPEGIARRSSDTGSLVVVVRERGSGRPIARAEVEAKPLGNPLPITIWTDANGAAWIPDLPAGEYALYVKSAEHLSSLFRARGSFIEIPPVSPVPSGAPEAPPLVSWPGYRRITLNRVETLSVQFDLPRAATISGEVLSPTMMPVAGSQVSVLELARSINRHRSFYRVASLTTDRDGRFRHTGLAPGEYFIRVIPEPGPPPAGTPAYYPWTSDSSKAEAVSLEYGGEAFVTLSGSVLPSGSLNGRVVVPDGVGFDSVSVEIRQLDGQEPGHIISYRGLPVDSAGRFSANELACGVYIVRARSGHDRVSRSSPAPHVTLSLVEVGGARTTEVLMRLQQSATISGTYEWVTTKGVPPTDRWAGISLEAEGPLASERWDVLESDYDQQDDAFRITGVVGAMRINPYRQKGWVLAAVRLEDGSDVLARMIDCDPGATYDNVRVIFTEDVAEVVGRVPAGAPPSTLLYGLLFPEDEHLWYPGSSWIREEMLGSESQVVLGDVPVGAAYYALLLDYEGGLCDDRMSPRG